MRDLYQAKGITKKVSQLAYMREKVQLQTTFEMEHQVEVNILTRSQKASGVVYSPLKGSATS